MEKSSESESQSTISSDCESIYQDSKSKAMGDTSESDSCSPWSSEDECFDTSPFSQVSPPPDPAQPSKILMIHGDAMSGASFSHKTRFFHPLLSRACPHGYTLSYPTAPNEKLPHDLTTLYISSNSACSPHDNDFDAWAWGFGDYTKEKAVGWEASVRMMIAYIKLHGPFDGVIGFSAGAGMALCLISLTERRLPPSPIKDALGLDEGDMPKPFKWAILFSGFRMYHDYYKALYEPRVKTPCLHFIGRLDTYVPSNHTLDFTKVCEMTEVLWHEGAHALCKGREAKEKIVEWVNRWNGNGGAENHRKEVMTLLNSGL